MKGIQTTKTIQRMLACICARPARQCLQHKLIAMDKENLQDILIDVKNHWWAYY